MEYWKTIPGFSLYEASDTGLVRSTNYNRSGKTQTLKPATNKQGYLTTMIVSDSGKYVSQSIHYFVTLAFYGKRIENYEVNHKDGNKANNNISNLEYVTRQQNMEHSLKNKLQKVFVTGSKHGQAKLNEEQVREIREYVANFPGKYYGRKQLAEKYGVSDAHIKDIINRRRNIWKTA